MILNNNDFEVLVLCSMRYALGRKTYVVQEICNIINDNKEKLSNLTIEIITKEVQAAIQNNKAGMDMDVNQWENLVHNLNYHPYYDHIHEDDVEGCR